MIKHINFLLILFIALGCKSEETKDVFIHDFEGTKPWSDAQFPSDEEFTFAVVSDLNGGERPRVFEVAAHQLSLLKPELIVSVGDLIDGGTEDTSQLEKEFNSFDERAALAGVPFFYVGGNHDLTNTVMRKYWVDRYGARYYHFLYKDVLFLILDSEDYEEERMQEIYIARAEAIAVIESDSSEKAPTMEYFKMPERRTGEISEDQSKYFEEILSQYPDPKWTFLFMHKPVWMRKREEGSLKRIEKALEGRNYTVINGHFHNYYHEKRNGMDYIIMGTTGGSQNPESDMAFDHIMFITMSSSGPSFANLKLNGILDKTGKIPAGGDTLNFQASSK